MKAEPFTFKKVSWPIISLVFPFPLSPRRNPNGASSLEDWGQHLQITSRKSWCVQCTSCYPQRWNSVLGFGKSKNDSNTFFALFKWEFHLLLILIKIQKCTHSEKDNKKMWKCFTVLNQFRVIIDCSFTINGAIFCFDNSEELGDPTVR